MDKVAIYSITHRPTGHVYVGGTGNLRKRWSKHRRELIAGNHHNSKLQRAWLKYGADQFEFAVIEEVAAPYLVREQHWIDTLKPHFNLSLVAGRPSGRVGPHSEATKAKIRAKRALQVMTSASIEKRRAAITGVKRSPEACKAISDGLTGKSLSAEHRAAIAAVRAGTTIPPEVRAKMSATHLARHAARKVAP